MDQTTTTTEVTTPTTASHDVDTVAAAAASSTSSSTATSSATEQAVDGLLGAGLLPYAIRDTSSTRRRCANREMLVLMHRMLEGKKQGFYVDAGGAADHRFDTTRYDIAAREFSEETAATLYRLATATEASPSSTGDTAHQGDGDGSSMDIEAQAMSQEARVEASKAWIQGIMKPLLNSSSDRIRPVTTNKYVSYLVPVPLVDADAINALYSSLELKQKPRVFEWIPAAALVAGTQSLPLHARINRPQLVKQLIELTANLAKDVKESSVEVHSTGAAVPIPNDDADGDGAETRWTTSGRNGLPTVVDRYYDQFIATAQLLRAWALCKPNASSDWISPVDTEWNCDQYVYQHTNGLCIIGLAASHSIPRLGKQVTSINYNVGKVDRLQNQVQGKRKKGGIWMEVSSPLCEIKCTDGSEFLVLACVRGHLIEINRRLVDDPSLLSSPQKATTEGFIAILKPTFQEIDTAANHLTCVSSR